MTDEEVSTVLLAVKHGVVGQAPNMYIHSRGNLLDGEERARHLRVSNRVDKASALEAGKHLCRE